jgi:hypothetical protein
VGLVFVDCVLPPFMQFDSHDFPRRRMALSDWCDCDTCGPYCSLHWQSDSSLVHLQLVLSPRHRLSAIMEALAGRPVHRPSEAYTTDAEEAWHSSGLHGSMVCYEAGSSCQACPRPGTLSPGPPTRPGGTLWGGFLSPPFPSLTRPSGSCYGTPGILAWHRVRMPGTVGGPPPLVCLTRGHCLRRPGDRLGSTAAAGNARHCFQTRGILAWL